MSISRILPRSERAVQTALLRAKKRVSTAGPADDALTPTTKTLLDNEKRAMDNLIGLAAVMTET